MQGGWKRMKKNNKEEKKGSGDSIHVLKLFERTAVEIKRVFFEHNMRVQIRELLGEFEDSLKDMEKKDFEYNQLPEIKIKNLREELERNDRILEKNEKGLRNQIQEGLYKKGYPVGSAWYDSMLEKMKMDIQEINLKLDSGFEAKYPQFYFQLNPKWIELQMLFHKKNLDAIKENIKELEHNIEIVQQEINEQTERVTARRNQILEELEVLGQDISEFTKKNHDYIG